MPRDISVRPPKQAKRKADEPGANEAPQTKAGRPAPREEFFKTPQIKTLKQLVEFDDIPFPTTAKCSSAGLMMVWITQAHAVLARALIELDEPNGALNQKAGFRQKKSLVGEGFTSKHVELLYKLRLDLELHLCEYQLSLSRPAEGSGGDTARWSVGTNMWVIICMISCVLHRYGFGKDVLMKYNPWSSIYLRSQKLVLDSCPVMDYSLRSVIDTIMNWLERLDTIKVYRDELWDLLKVLRYALAKYIVGSGTSSTGWDAAEWTAPVALAQTAERRDVVTTDGKISGMECVTTDFVCQSAVWVTTIENYLRLYVMVSRITIPLPAVPSKEEARDAFFKGGQRMTYKWVRSDIATTRKCAWFPSDYVMRRAMTFFCVYAQMANPNANEARTMAVRFEPLPSDATVFRAYTGMENAAPKDVLTYKFLNRSQTGIEFSRIIQYDRPLLKILHEWWNWRYGETRIRSESMHRLGFNRELIWIYLIDLFFANKDVKGLRTLININHRDSTAAFAVERARQSGLPCIIQQFGFFTVMVPREIPTDFAFEESEATRRGNSNLRAAERFMQEYVAADLNKGTAEAEEAEIGVDADDHHDHDHERAAPRLRQLFVADSDDDDEGDDADHNGQSRGMIGEHSSASHMRRRKDLAGYMIVEEPDVRSRNNNDNNDDDGDSEAGLDDTMQSDPVPPHDEPLEEYAAGTAEQRFQALTKRGWVYDPALPVDLDDPYWDRGKSRDQEDYEGLYMQRLRRALAGGWEPPFIVPSPNPSPPPPAPAAAPPGVAIVTDADDDDDDDVESDSLFGDNEDMLADAHLAAAKAAEAAGVPGEDSDVPDLELVPEEELLARAEARDMLPPEIGNVPLDRRQQLRALRALQTKEDEDGVEAFISRMKERGEKLPEEKPDQTLIRCYDCATYLEAFLVFGTALCYWNGGVFRGSDYNDFFFRVCGWSRDAGENEDDVLDAFVDDDDQQQEEQPL